MVHNVEDRTVSYPKRRGGTLGNNRKGNLKAQSLHMVEETNVGMIKKKKRRKKEGWSVPRSLATEEAQSYPSCRLSKASWHGRSQIPSSLKSLQIFKKHSPWQKKRLGEETAYKVSGRIRHTGTGHFSSCPVLSSNHGIYFVLDSTTNFKCNNVVSPTKKNSGLYSKLIRFKTNQEAV